MAELPLVQKLDPTACETFREDMRDNKGFYSVLALGDATGRAICTADSSVKMPLPSMADRLYYQRAKTSKGLVVGEYAVSRTTGKQALHFAYPIRSTNGEFRGLLLAAVDLNWFVSSTVDEYFRSSDVQVLAVDQAGKMLYSYPSQNIEVGKPMFDAREASWMLSGSNPYFVKRDPEGVWRVYAYESMPEGMSDQMLVLVGFAIHSFVGMLVLIGALTVGSLYYIYVLLVGWKSNR